MWPQTDGYFAHQRWLGRCQTQTVEGFEGHSLQFPVKQYFIYVISANALLLLYFVYLLLHP